MKWHLSNQIPEYEPWTINHTDTYYWQRKSMKAHMIDGTGAMTTLKNFPQRMEIKILQSKLRPILKSSCLKQTCYSEDQGYL